MKGFEGLQKIQDIMNSLRQNPPAEFAGHKVVAVRDYKADTIKNLETGEVTPTGLPNSNVLYYELTNDAWVCVRPSGTEPKVKFYYGVKVHLWQMRMKNQQSWAKLFWIWLTP